MQEGDLAVVVDRVDLVAGNGEVLRAEPDDRGERVHAEIEENPNSPTHQQALKVAELNKQRNAEAIKANLKNIKMPPGFKIELYAVVPDARHMAVAPNTNMLFVGTRKTTVWAVTDRNSDGVADEVKSFAPSLKFTNPNGVCWTKDGFLIVAEHNRVLNFPAAEFFYESPDIAVAVVIPQGELIPKEDESFNHTARVCRVGADNKIYITLGQPFNVPAKNKLDGFAKYGIGGIIRVDRMKNRRSSAKGMRKREKA